MNRGLAIVVLALVCAAGVSAHTIFIRPDPYLVGGVATVTASASNAGPCGPGTPSGTQTILADFPYWAQWDGHQGHNAGTGLSIQFKLYQNNVFLLDVQTSAFMTGNMYMDQIVIDSAAVITAKGGNPANADGRYQLQLTFNDGTDIWYNCADIDLIIPAAHNGFPADGIHLLEGTSATTGLITPTPGQAKFVAFHPTFDFNQNNNDPYMFYRVSVTGSGVMNKHVNLMANAFMLSGTVSRTDVIEALPSMANAMVKASTLDDGKGITSLCRIVGNTNLDNQWEYMIAAVPGAQATSTDTFSVAVESYLAEVGAGIDVEVAPHDGYMYYYTRANSAGGKNTRLLFIASTGAFEEGFVGELAENCQMTTNRYVAMAAAGDAQCIDLPQTANRVYYIRTQNAQQQYRMRVETGKCAEYDSAGSSVAGSVVLATAAAAALLL